MMHPWARLRMRLCVCLCVFVEVEGSLQNVLPLNAGHPKLSAAVQAFKRAEDGDMCVYGGLGVPGVGPPYVLSCLQLG